MWRVPLFKTQSSSCSTIHACYHPPSARAAAPFNQSHSSAPVLLITRDRARNGEGSGRQREEAILRRNSSDTRHPKIARGRRIIARDGCGAFFPADSGRHEREECRESSVSLVLCNRIERRVGDASRPKNTELTTKRMWL